MVGYDGGRVAAERLADHVVVTRSEHIPRIQEAQASAWHVLRELMELKEARSGCGDRHGAGRGLSALRVPPGGRARARGLRAQRRARGGGGGRGRLGGGGRFLERLPAEAPPLATVEAVSAEEVPPAGGAASRSPRARGGAPLALVSPDVATCPACLAEIVDPADRRYGYPFINCTDCGPRFTIVRGVPYDRPLTTMAAFEMCSRCQAEYDDPADRRFHAQPNACPECGPCWSARRGGDRGGSPRGGVAALRAGGGGDQGAGWVPPGLPAPSGGARAAALRSRKHREDKPFALMAATLSGGAEAGGADPRRGGTAAGSGAADRDRPPARRRARWRRRWRPARPTSG